MKRDSRETSRFVSLFDQGTIGSAVCFMKDLVSFYHSYFMTRPIIEKRRSVSYTTRQCSTTSLRGAAIANCYHVGVRHNLTLTRTRGELRFHTYGIVPHDSKPCDAQPSEITSNRVLRGSLCIHIGAVVHRWSATNVPLLNHLPLKLLTYMPIVISLLGTILSGLPSFV
ncbi:hypothetical protein BV22DRAFT_1035244 [Leucogyrophana mollusca]|uniref:Uncharacterized protein n=1 Tax=Leucogyrophana mollusca TaxID=85980 RepID=A0ACB8BHR9_9AGAM|nr:hypothetical protein BV22DRAFT_1035244 [Leucogyrophana mollusca]